MHRTLSRLALLLGVLVVVGCGADASGVGDPSDTGASTQDTSTTNPDGNSPGDDLSETSAPTGGSVTGPDPDTDGDGITDPQEGAAENTDTDGDGTPDYLDNDSDDDGIPDIVEAGDSDLNTPPRDSDGDGVADFRETDADNDTIPDTVEAGELGQPPRDTDNDGLPDFADIDSDGDDLADRDEAGDLDPNTPPVDSDGDGTPDYRDIDSDDDGIGDLYEGNVDTDDDGTVDRFDDDSDADGILDSAEAGDGDPSTPPADSDGDGVGDFRELDGDNDGIPDTEEVTTHMTSPTKRDTVDDGAPDIVELVAMTNPLDPNSNPAAQGDFFFVVPFNDVSFPERDTLQFETSVQRADLYFAIDASTSMNEEYTALRDTMTGISTVVDQLTCQTTTTPCVKHIDCAADQRCGIDGFCLATDPSVSQCVPDLWTGVGRFGNVDSFENLLSVQSDPMVTATNIPSQGTSARPGGAGTPLSGPWVEAPFHAASCAADGSNCLNTDKNCASGGVGCPGFRNDAVRIYVQISDADDQCADPFINAANSADFGNIFFGMGRCSGFDAAAAGAALRAQQIKFIGLFSNEACAADITEYRSLPFCDDYPEQDYNNFVTSMGLNRPLLPMQTSRTVPEEIGVASGTVDPMGNPFVYEALDAAVTTQMIAAVREIISNASLRVTIAASDIAEPSGEMVDAAQFIGSFEVDSTSGGDCTMVTPTSDSDNDGVDDTFPQLLPGTSVCWRIYPVMTQTLVEATDSPQVFRARLTVSGDGSPLDRRDVFFLVPPRPPMIIN